MPGPSRDLARSASDPTAALRHAFAFCVAAWLLILVAVPALAWEPPTDGLQPVPALKARVTDLTQTLAPAEVAALEAKSADWETRTGNQLVVLMVTTTQPEAIETYSIRVGEAWKIGRRGQDNGVLLLVAKADKKVRIEVGYGLEGVLTDVTSRRIIAETMAPAFRDGRFGSGLIAGTDRIIRVVGDGGAMPPVVMKKTAPAARSVFPFDFETLLVVVLVVVPLVGVVLRGIFGRLLGSTIGAGVIGTAAWFVAGTLVIAVLAAIIAFFVMIFAGAGSGLAGRRRGGVYLPGGGWGGGGWSGGGGGGFSGGGGGFGGGGASGGWD